MENINDEDIDNASYEQPQTPKTVSSNEDLLHESKTFVSKQYSVGAELDRDDHYQQHLSKVATAPVIADVRDDGLPIEILRLQKELNEGPFENVSAPHGFVECSLSESEKMDTAPEIEKKVLIKLDLVPDEVPQIEVVEPGEPVLIVKETEVRTSVTPPDTEMVPHKIKQVSELQETLTDVQIFPPEKQESLYQTETGLSKIGPDNKFEQVPYEKETSTVLESAVPVSAAIVVPSVIGATLALSHPGLDEEDEFSTKYIPVISSQQRSFDSDKTIVVGDEEMLIEVKPPEVFPEEIGLVTAPIVCEPMMREFDERIVTEADIKPTICEPLSYTEPGLNLSDDVILHEGNIYGSYTEPAPETIVTVIEEKRPEIEFDKVAPQPSLIYTEPHLNLDEDLILHEGVIYGKYPETTPAKTVTFVDDKQPEIGTEEVSYPSLSYSEPGTNLKDDVILHEGVIYESYSEPSESGSTIITEEKLPQMEYESVPEPLSYNEPGLNIKDDVILHQGVIYGSYAEPSPATVIEEKRSEIEIDEVPRSSLAYTEPGTNLNDDIILHQGVIYGSYAEPVADSTTVKHVTFMEEKLPENLEKLYQIEDFFEPIPTDALSLHDVGLDENVKIDVQQVDYPGTTSVPEAVETEKIMGYIEPQTVFTEEQETFDVKKELPIGKENLIAEEYGQMPSVQFSQFGVYEPILLKTESGLNEEQKLIEVPLSNFPLSPDAPTQMILSEIQYQEKTAEEQLQCQPITKVESQLSETEPEPPVVQVVTEPTDGFDVPTIVTEPTVLSGEEEEMLHLSQAPTAQFSQFGVYDTMLMKTDSGLNEDAQLPEIIEISPFGEAQEEFLAMPTDLPEQNITLEDQPFCHSLPRVHSGVSELGIEENQMFALIVSPIKSVDVRKTYSEWQRTATTEPEEFFLESQMPTAQFSQFGVYEPILMKTKSGLVEKPRLEEIYPELAQTAEKVELFDQSTLESQQLFTPLSYTDTGLNESEELPVVEIKIGQQENVDIKKLVSEKPDEVSNEFVSRPVTELLEIKAFPQNLHGQPDSAIIYQSLSPMHVPPVESPPILPDSESDLIREAETYYQEKVYTEGISPTPKFPRSSFVEAMLAEDTVHEKELPTSTKEPEVTEDIPIYENLISPEPPITKETVPVSETITIEVTEQNLDTDADFPSKPSRKKKDRSKDSIPMSENIMVKPEDGHVEVQFPQDTHVFITSVQSEQPLNLSEELPVPKTEATVLREDEIMTTIISADSEGSLSEIQSFHGVPKVDAHDKQKHQDQPTVITERIDIVVFEEEEYVPQDKLQQPTLSYSESGLSDETHPYVEVGSSVPEEIAEAQKSAGMFAAETETTILNVEIVKPQSEAELKLTFQSHINYTETSTEQKIGEDIKFGQPTTGGISEEKKDENVVTVFLAEDAGTDIISPKPEPQDVEVSASSWTTVEIVNPPSSAELEISFVQEAYHESDKDQKTFQPLADKTKKGVKSDLNEQQITIETDRTSLSSVDHLQPLPSPLRQMSPSTEGYCEQMVDDAIRDALSSCYADLDLSSSISESVSEISFAKGKKGFIHLRQQYSKINLELSFIYL